MGEKIQPQSAELHLAEAKQETHLKGTQYSPQADGVCWTPAGRCLSDAHSHIFLPLPPLQRPKGSSAAATFPSQTPCKLSLALSRVGPIH